ncbi:Kunitz/Bovine pancreatic trypsin inhibitor domain protein, partial [Ostertagia ostertagi]
MCQQFLWDPTAVGQGEHSPNNFKTIEHCESYCRDASVCGPIGGRPLDTSIYSRGSVYHNGSENRGTTPSTRFFYDPATGKCSPFTYLGAAGNYNNFLSRIDCELYCARSEPRCLQGQAYKDTSGKFVTCSTNRAASSCPINYECYHDGNMYGCCPTKAFTCSLASNPGKTCGPGVSFKFYYNAQTQ